MHSRRGSVDAFKKRGWAIEDLKSELLESTSLERRFEIFRGRAGAVLAPLAFLVVLLTPFADLKPQAHRLAAVMAAVVVLWVCETVPMPVTALLGAAACVVLEVAPAKEVFAPFADQLMFLFIGSFILARAIFLHHLDRRLAFSVLSHPWVGARPGRILFAFGAATAFLSAWVSNTATTAMMFAIGLSILNFLFEAERAEGRALSRRYATGLMLMTAFAASIGGLATPIGTPPNIIGLGYIRNDTGVEISFFEWSLIGVPVVVVLYLFMFSYLNFLCPASSRELTGSREMLERSKRELGPWSRGQISTLIACLFTVTLWITPGVIGFVAGDNSDVYKMITKRMPEAFAALVGAGLLFVLPGNRERKAITWDEAVQIDWGVVLLYGGGFALGVLSNNTGLADAIGRSMIAWLPDHGEFGMLVASTIVATLVSEATSNTASANIVVPVVIALSKAANIDPLEPALGATFGSSLGFMLPVSTPCNAIVYGSGLIPLPRMIAYGALLDVAGVVTIITMVHLLVGVVR